MIISLSWVNPRINPSWPRSRHWGHVPIISGRPHLWVQTDHVYKPWRTNGSRQKWWNHDMWWLWDSLPPSKRRYGLSQWETTLQCNVVSHWLIQNHPYQSIECGSMRQYRWHTRNGVLKVWHWIGNRPLVKLANRHRYVSKPLRVI